MSFATNLSGMLGLNNDFNPQTANLTATTDKQQLDGAYGQAQSGIQQQQSFLNALNGQNGIANQSSVFGQMQAQNGQLQQQANGTGVNPALAQLQQTTGQNVSNQAALMAGQRGTGANAGLVARQAAMQGAATQQQAVGQGATMAAQQQVAAQQQLMQNNANMAGLAGQQVNQQAAATSGLNSAAQGEQGMLLNAQQGYNSTLQQGTIANNTINAGVASGNQATGNGIIGGIMGGASKFASGFFAHGGEVPGMQQGSGFSRYITADAPQAVKPANISRPDGGWGAIIAKADGGAIPGSAPVPGDSYANDTVPAMLSPGEVVIPRSVMQSKDPAAAAKKFVAAMLAKKGKGA